MQFQNGPFLAILYAGLNSPCSQIRCVLGGRINRLYSNSSFAWMVVMITEEEYGGVIITFFGLKLEPAIASALGQ